MNNNSARDEWEDMLNNINSLEESQEVLDRTKVYLRLIDATRDLDRMEQARGILETTLQLVEKLTQIVHLSPEVQAKALDTFGQLVEGYLGEEEQLRKNRLREMVGFGKDPKEEATRKAREQVDRILSDMEQSSSTSIDVLEEATRLMKRIDDQLDQMMEGSALDSEDEQRLEAIREQIRNDSN